MLVNSSHDPAAGVVDAACLFILPAGVVPVDKALFISSTLVDAEAAVDCLVVSSFILLLSSSIFLFASAIRVSGFKVVPAVLVGPSVEPLGSGEEDPCEVGEDDPSGGDEDELSGGGEDEPSGGDEEDPSGGCEDDPSDGGEDDPSGGCEDDPSEGGEDEPSGGCDDCSSVGAGDASHSSSIAAAPESTCLKQYSSDDGLPSLV